MFLNDSQTCLFIRDLINNINNHAICLFVFKQSREFIITVYNGVWAK